MIYSKIKALVYIGKSQSITRLSIGIFQALRIMGFPQEAILQMYQAIRPSTKSIAEALIVFNVPFTIAKGLISVIITSIIYKPLEKLIKKM